MDSIIKKLTDILSTSRYIKVKKRTIMAIFVRLSQCLLLPAEHQLKAQSIDVINKLNLTTTELPDILQNDRDPILFFIRLVDNFRLEAHLMKSMAALALDESDLSASERDDLDKSVRPFPECARCHSASSFPCPQCHSLAYCGLVCQAFHWISVHSKDCKALKKD